MTPKKTRLCPDCKGELRHISHERWECDACKRAYGPLKVLQGRPPSEKPSAAQPPEGKSSVEQPPEGKSSAEKPPAEKSSVETLADEKPSGAIARSGEAGVRSKKAPRGRPVVPPPVIASPPAMVKPGTPLLKVQPRRRRAFRWRAGVLIAAGTAASIVILGIALAWFWTGGRSAELAKGNGDANGLDAKELKALSRPLRAAGPSQGASLPGPSLFDDAAKPAQAGSSASVEGQAGWVKSLRAWVISPDEIPLLDGVALEGPAALVPNDTWILVAPTGQHVFQRSAGGQAEAVNAAGGFAGHYRQQAARYQREGTYDFERLAQATRATVGTYVEPLLPHFWGNYYWEQKEQDAAIRHWSTAVRLAPAFAPSHVNLAYAYLQRGELERSARETAIASALNVQDAYAVADHLLELRNRLGFDKTAGARAEMREEDYERTHPELSEIDRHVADIYEALARYSTSAAGRARCWNNLGVYLLRERNEAQASLYYLQQGLNELVSADVLGEESELVKQLLANAGEAAAAGQLPERFLYAKLSGKN